MQKVSQVSMGQQHLYNLSLRIGGLCKTFQIRHRLNVYSYEAKKRVHKYTLN